MKIDWKMAWSVSLARLDALSLRERGVLCLVVVVCTATLANVWWLSPAKQAHAALQLRFVKQSADLLRARAALNPNAKAADANLPVRLEIARVKEQLAAVSQALEAALPTATPLSQVLVYFLQRYEGLTLLSTVALPPVTEAADAIPAAIAAAAPTAPRQAPLVLMRQGVALTVSGPYPELVRYVSTLEQSLPYVRWGSMKLRGDKSPPELTLQLFLVGVKP